ncbi:MAG TPA: thioesterase domain-containing protein [Micromonosporaceae bacterium]|nr:thioesterase domain-containing protein [Micromonosporaceae bacterium]
MRLFCLPHAGGTAGHFNRWNRWLPAGVTAVPVELPGRGTRQAEPLLDSWPPLVEDVARTVRARGGGAYALAGHSLGAVLAFEVARALARDGDPPRLLLVAARNGPYAGLSHRPIHGLGDAQLLDALRRLGGSPEAILGEPDLMRLFLPVLRVDLRLAETYARLPGPPLSCPVAAYAGRRDRMTGPEAVLAWHRETTEAFDLTIVDAGHFLLDHPAFVAAVAARLARLGPPDAPAPASARSPGRGRSRTQPAPVGAGGGGSGEGGYDRQITGQKSGSE